jgi:hypothetical protein
LIGVRIQKEVNDKTMRQVFHAREARLRLTIEAKKELIKINKELVSL